MADRTEGRVVRLVAAHPPVSDLHAVTSAFEDADRILANPSEVRGSTGEDPESCPGGRERQINGQAYFLLAWGQLEADITDACRSAIRKGQSQRKWRDRRAWSLYDPDDRRLSGLSFRSRLALVLDRNDSAWKKAIGLYGIRNRIAHGDLGVERLTMGGAIRELVRVQQSVARD